MEITGYRALVVDDEPYVRELAARALSKRALQCDSASNGDEAMVLMSQYQYDAVITDLRMPKRHGHSLAVEILAMPDRPRVFILTGLAEPRLMQDLESRGVDDIIQKPVDFDELATRVLSHIDPAFGIEADGANQGASHLLAEIEKTLLELTEMFADRMEDIFNVSGVSIDPPAAVNDYIARLEEEEMANEEQHNSHKDRGKQLGRRHSRARAKATALAVPVSRHFAPSGQPFNLALRDVSESGARLLHTRATSAEYLALKWPCITQPFRHIEVVAKVMRCDPLSRFYDYGCQFVLAD